MPRPEKVRIPYEAFEGGRFNAVGRLLDGTQFMAFVTGAFPSGQDYYIGDDWAQRKRWLAVVHRFDADGAHLGSESRIGGVEADGESAVARAFENLEDLLRILLDGEVPQLGDINVRLFSVVLDGVFHGLVYEEDEGEEGHTEWVMLQPQDVMFHSPWDGEYSS